MKAVKCVAVLFLWSNEKCNCWVFVWKTFRWEVQNPEWFFFFFKLKFLCGKCLKTVWCFWSLCVAVTEKPECMWLIFDKRRDICVEILCNGFRADFKGTVELFWFLNCRRLQTSWALVCMILPVLRCHDVVRPECSDQSITLHYVNRYSNIPLMELFIYVHFV